MNNLRLIECLDVLAAVMTEDHVAGPAPQPASYVDWVMRMRSTITLMPDSDEGATSRRRIHAALVCGDDHTPLERAWTRYREDPALRALLDEIEALTSDPMYSCPCCRCLTLPARPPASWCRCPVCGWEDDGTLGGDGPNKAPLAVAQEAFRTRAESIPSHLRPPRPEELPPG